ncbi:MAG: ABC transporter permease [Lactobacillaceae bacterium]|jgi:ABC-2 type transport system permease protein|nr:ABC transporter permease [Lactobacillaceae bacterium]
MLSVLRQEIFKQLHQKTFLVFTAIITFSPLALALLLSIIPGRTILDNAYTFTSNDGLLSPFLFLFMLIEFAQIITSEFQFDTIKVQVAKGNSRLAIFFGKVTTLVFDFIVWTIFGTLMTIVTSFIFGYTKHFGQTNHSAYLKIPKHFFQQIIEGSVPNFMVIFLIGGLILLISTLLKSNAIAITLGVVSWLAGQIINGILMQYFYESFHFVKYNLFNVIVYWPLQFFDEKVASISRLSNNEMIITWTVWVVLLYGIAVISFKKRNL